MTSAIRWRGDLDDYGSKRHHFESALADIRISPRMNTEE